MRKNQGFTLIEVIIVVAIVGILAGIALPVYLNYIARGEAGSALATLAPLKTSVDTILAKDPEVDLTQVSNLGSSANTNILGTISSTVDRTTGSGSLVFTFGNSSPQTQGRTLRLVRNGDNGGWACLTNVEPVHRPFGCNAG